MVNEQSTDGFLGTYRPFWYDINEKGTSYEVQRMTPHLVATKDPFNRPTAVSFGPNVAVLVRLVGDKHIQVRMEAMLACGFSSSGRAREAALRAARFPTDAGIQEALDDTTDFFEHSQSSKL